MRITLIALKLAALVGIVTFSYYLCMPNGLRGARTSGAVMLAVGLLSLNKEIVLKGNGTGPALLHMFSIMFFLGPLMFLSIIPYELYSFGFTKHLYTISFRETLTYLLVGILMALWLWFPITVYELIDRLIVKRYITPKIEKPRYR